MTAACRARQRAPHHTQARHVGGWFTSARRPGLLRGAGWLRASLLVCSLMANAVAHSEADVPPARDVAGVPFAGALALDEQRLVLQGAGVRAKMIVKVYAMGLYLAAPVPSGEALLALQQPHRLRLVMLRDVDARRMSDGLAHAMLDGLSPTDVARLTVRVHRLAEALLAHGDVHRGEEIWLDYRPASGTRVSVAGTAVLPDIEGADFNAAMLGMWVGEHAPDERLKAVLLGLPPP